MNGRGLVALFVAVHQLISLAPSTNRGWSAVGYETAGSRRTCSPSGLLTWRWNVFRILIRRSRSRSRVWSEWI